jgi:hypothetical protein
VAQKQQAATPGAPGALTWLRLRLSACCITSGLNRVVQADTLALSSSEALCWRLAPRGAGVASSMITK